MEKKRTVMSSYSFAAFLLLTITVAMPVSVCCKKIEIYSFHVNLDGSEVKIVVSAGEEPVDVARKFREKHRLDDDAEKQISDHLCFNTYLRCRRTSPQKIIVTATINWHDPNDGETYQIDFSLGKEEKTNPEKAVFGACRPLAGKWKGCPRRVFVKLLDFVKSEIERAEAMRWETGNHYDILDVEKNSPVDVIKKSYRKLSRFLHPDVNKAADAQEKFIKLRDAYECLGDEDRRYQYDIKKGFKQPPFSGFRFGNRFYRHIQSDGRGGFFVVI